MIRLMPLKDVRVSPSNALENAARPDPDTHRRLLRKRMEKTGNARFMEAFATREKADQAEITRHSQAYLKKKDELDRRFFEEQRRRRSPTPALTYGDPRRHPMTREEHEASQARSSSPGHSGNPDPFLDDIRRMVYAATNPALETLVRKAEFSQKVKDTYNREARGVSSERHGRDRE